MDFDAAMNCRKPGISQRTSDRLPARGFRVGSDDVRDAAGCGGYQIRGAPALLHRSRLQPICILVLGSDSLVDCDSYQHFSDCADSSSRRSSHPAVAQRHPGSGAGDHHMVFGDRGFRAYLQHFGDFTTIYGSLGVAMALLVWMYFISLMVLVGAEFNALLFPRAMLGKELTAINSKL